MGALVYVVALGAMIVYLVMMVGDKYDDYIDARYGCKGSACKSEKTEVNEHKEKLKKQSKDQNELSKYAPLRGVESKQNFSVRTADVTGSSKENSKVVLEKTNEAPVMVAVISSGMNDELDSLKSVSYLQMSLGENVYEDILIAQESGAQIVNVALDKERLHLWEEAALAIDGDSNTFFVISVADKEGLERAIEFDNFNHPNVRLVTSAKSGLTIAQDAAKELVTARTTYIR